MLENSEAGSSPNNDFVPAPNKYLNQAAQAMAAGDEVLAMHLYLAAYEQSMRDEEQGAAPSDEALAGLKQAWALACQYKERSLAEYIFERLEPMLSAEELQQCAMQLQGLALSKLEEFGLSPEDLQDMTDMIAQEVADLENSGGIVGMGISGAGGPGSPGAPRIMKLNVKKPEPEEEKPEPAPDVNLHVEELTYADLAGYDETIRAMRTLGIGMHKNGAYQELVKVLNARHGLDHAPAPDSLLFRAPIREDATRFMEATAGELEKPIVRMRLEENIQGSPVLCVMTPAGNAPKMNRMRNAIEGPGVLLIEDLDIWVMPHFEENPEEPISGLVQAHLSRGAREAVNLIRSAVENPDVHVLASASMDTDIDPFFCNLLEPFTMVDIDLPTPGERADIWMDIARRHPSMRGVDRAQLVRLSHNMPRYDMYMAAREAIDDAYKASLAAGHYCPVMPDNIFEKLAAFQPLDSNEYRALEDAVILDFRRELEDLEREMDTEE